MHSFIRVTWHMSYTWRALRSWTCMWRAICSWTCMWRAIRSFTFTYVTCNSCMNVWHAFLIYIRHASPKVVVWVRLTSDSICSYVWHESFMFLTRLIHVLTRLIHILTRLIHVFDTTRSCDCIRSRLIHMNASANMYVTWVICMQHESPEVVIRICHISWFTCRIWLICVYHVTSSYGAYVTASSQLGTSHLWLDSFICGPWAFHVLTRLLHKISIAKIHLRRESNVWDMSHPK